MDMIVTHRVGSEQQIYLTAGVGAGRGRAGEKFIVLEELSTYGSQGLTC